MCGVGQVCFNDFGKVVFCAVSRQQAGAGEISRSPHVRRKWDRPPDDASILCCAADLLVTSASHEPLKQAGWRPPVAKRTCYSALAFLLERRSAPLAFRQVSAGWEHSCGGTTSSRAYCWGATDYSQLGNGKEVGFPQPIPVPLAPPAR